MKNKILLILVLLVLSGCGKNKTENINKNSTNLSYNMVSYVTEKIDDNNTRVYAIIENTSKNSGKIEYISYAILDSEHTIINKGKLDYKKQFNAKEQKIIIFTVPINIEKIAGAYVTPFYSNDKAVSSSDKKIKTTQVKAAAGDKEIKVLKNGSNIKMNAYFVEDTKVNKLKIAMYNEYDYPMCIAYVNVNKKLKKDAKYTYEFNCETIVDDNGYVLFENVK